MIPDSVRSFIATGPVAHVVTLAEDGSPQVSLAWVGIEGEEIVIATLFDQRKLRNLRRDPRIALSFTTGTRNLLDCFSSEYFSSSTTTFCVCLAASNN